MLFHRDPRLHQMLVEHLKENGPLLFTVAMLAVILLCGAS
jgi:hypothetical protein